MGNSNSGCAPKSGMNGGARNLYNLMRAEPTYTEQNTIKFSRNDLANTLSDRSIMDAIHNGGKRKARRERYKEYETQQIKNKNQNFFGGALSDSINIDFTSDHKYSTVSEGELSALKNLIMQNGGGCGCGDDKVITGGHVCTNVMNGGCGCGENTVLKGGFLNIGSATSSASFYGNVADLSATSDLNNTLNNSATSTVNFGALNNNLSVTSDVNYTSNNTHAGLSATSTLSGGSPQVNSAMERLQKIAQAQFGGFNDFGTANSTSDLISALSNSDISSLSGPVNYSNIIGGGWDNKMSRTEETEKQSSSSKTESSTTITGGDSEMSRINKLESASTSSKRSKKASSTSSDGSSITSSISGSTDSSSVSGSSSNSSSSSTTLYSANSGTMTNKVYLTSTMSGGEFIDAKQFYSSENGDLYSSDTNYLRHNLTKRRFR
jgi:hypothetical protein